MKFASNKLTANFDVVATTLRRASWHIRTLFDTEMNMISKNFSEKKLPLADIFLNVV